MSMNVIVVAMTMTTTRSVVASVVAVAVAGGYDETAMTVILTMVLMLARVMTVMMT